MKQKITDFMDKLLEDNIHSSDSIASTNAEKIGKKMEKAVQDMTRKYEDRDKMELEEPSEPEEPEEPDVENDDNVDDLVD